MIQMVFMKTKLRHLPNLFLNIGLQGLYGKGVDIKLFVWQRGKIELRGLVL